MKGVPLEENGPPKFKTATALLALVELYIRAPDAVKVELLHAMLVKVTNAFMPDRVIVCPNSTSPPATYPDPTTSPTVVYTVLFELMSATEVYRAILKVSPVSGVKSCTAANNSALNEAHNDWVIAILVHLISNLGNSVGVLTVLTIT